MDANFLAIVKVFKILKAWFVISQRIGCLQDVLLVEDFCIKIFRGSRSKRCKAKGSSNDVGNAGHERTEDKNFSALRNSLHAQFSVDGRHVHLVHETENDQGQRVENACDIHACSL